jgi:hypothetical protein
MPGARRGRTVRRSSVTAGDDHHVHDLTDTPPSCGHCGHPIGVYEPLVYERADGAPVTSAYLRLPDDVREARAPTTFFHAACHGAALGGAVATKA